MAWPPGVFSLTHVALPFPPDDPLYGSDPIEDGSGLLRLGRLSPRGERAVLIAGAVVHAAVVESVLCVSGRAGAGLGEALRRAPERSGGPKEKARGVDPRAFGKIIPAATYSPTHLRTQYHRR